MGMFTKETVPDWVLKDDADAAYAALKSFTEGSSMDRDDLLKALTLVVLDMKKVN